MGPEHLVVTRAARPRPGAGQVLVRTHAVSLNFMRAVSLRGVAAGPRDLFEDRNRAMGQHGPRRLGEPPARAVQGCSAGPAGSTMPARMPQRTVWSRSRECVFCMRPARWYLTVVGST